MKLGNKIKQLRQHKGITQETLASHLNISPQAISKWEQGSSTPDIGLLPNISSYFGVTIDDLFTLNGHVHIDRIENMLETQKDLNPEDINYIKTQLDFYLNNSDYEAKAHELLAQLYNHIAASNHQWAQKHAKKAIELAPERKINHVMYVEASRGSCTDWNYTNYSKIIDYYYDYVKINPDHRRGYQYLLDHLIRDGRVKEAEHVLDQLSQVYQGFLIDWYGGQILKARGLHDQALKQFEEMVNKDPENWLTHSTLGDELARFTQYEKAIECMLKSDSLQPKPRYIDNFECISHIHEINKNYDLAIEYQYKIIERLKEDWSITFGELVDQHQREIDRLSKK